MTVAENLVLARANLPIVIDWRKERAGAARRSWSACPSRSIRRASSARSPPASGRSSRSSSSCTSATASSSSTSRRACSRLPRPTRCSAMLRGMARAREISILMITHKFREVTSFADEVTVLRRGRVAGQGPVDGADAGADGGDDGGRRGAAARQSGALRPGGGRRRGSRCTTCAPSTTGASACSTGSRSRCARGEIVGIAGVSGNGQDELLEVIAGQRELAGGEIARQRRALPRRRATEARAAQPAVPARGAAAQRVRPDDERGREHRRSASYDRPPFTLAGWLVRRARAPAARGRMRRRLRHQDAHGRHPDVGASPAATCSARCSRGSCRASRASSSSPTRASGSISRPSRSSARGCSRPATRRRGAPHQRGSRRDLRARRPHPRHQRGTHRVRDAHREGRGRRHRKAHGRSRQSVIFSSASL